MSTTTTDRGDSRPYREFGIPTSWYRVAWSQDVAHGDVIPLRYFGRDLVLYRTAEGKAVVLDAHCQHLGAHLGHGGTVRDECIVCPFHGWSWRPDGTNESIPYATTAVRRTIKPWHVRESSGTIWVWFDANGCEPTFELPELPELADGTYRLFGPEASMVWPNVRIHPMQSVENTADPAHIRFVHGAGDIPSVDGFDDAGPVFSTFLRYEWGAGRERTSLTPNGPVEGVLNANCYGLGVIFTRYTGIWPTIQITGCTPIDDQCSDYYTAIMVKEGIDEKLHASITRHFIATVEADFPIWENMVWIEHPPLPRLESKVMRRVRAWSAQFTNGSNASGHDEPVTDDTAPLDEEAPVGQL